MCKFYDALPRKSKMVGNNKKVNLQVFMKPCPDENSYYRFRLLNFGSDGKNDRDYPFIKRFVHVKWGKNEKGTPVIVDQITCPVTPHVHVEGNRYQSCKVCDIAGKYYGTYKASNYTDKEAGRKNREFSRKLEWIVPVYVVNDPNYDGNNGKFKVIIFDTKDGFEEFKSKVEKASLTNRVFNGEDAVDCFMHMSLKEEVRNPGQPNEFKWKKRVIDRIGFTTKPYSIPSINKQTVSSMGFDDEYYTESTPEEILEFYNKHCTVSNDDIPTDDSDIPVYELPKPEPKVEKTNVVAPTIAQNEAKPSNDDISDADIDALTGPDAMTDAKAAAPLADEIPAPEPEVPAEIDNVPTTPAPAASNDSNTSEIDDLLAGIDL